jgi:hypothetical protein
VHVSVFARNLGVYSELTESSLVLCQRVHFRISATFQCRCVKRVTSLEVLLHTTTAHCVNEILLCEISSSHGGEYEAQNLLECTAVFECRPTFQLITRQYIPEDSELRNCIRFYTKFFVEYSSSNVVRRPRCCCGSVLAI